MNLHLTFISALAFLLVACTAQSDYNKMLVQADSLMTSRPDSALHILQGIAPQQLSAQADKAYYALLLTQARDKNYILQTDDSLIRIAVRYYDAQGDAAMQARAYYLWGSVHRDMNKQAEGVERYLKATTFAEKAGDQALLGRIYANAGYIYYLQELYEKANSAYRQAEQIGIQLRDTSLWISSLTTQGEIQLYQEHYLQAEEKLLQALKVSKGFKQNEIKVGIYSALSSLYARTGEGLKSLQYAKQNFSLQRDTLHCYRTFLELGDAYYQTGQYDSATIYIRKSLSSPSHATKAGAYMRLADLAKAQGDITQSLNMERLYSAYKDSAALSRQKAEIIEAEQTIKIQHQQTQYEHYLKEYRYYILISVLIAAGSIYLLRKHYLNRLNRQRQKALSKERELHRQYLSSKEETKRKEEQIATLQQQIEQQHVDEVQKKQMQRELEELNEQHTLLLKKTLQYSDIYAKMKRMISDYKKRRNSKESLTDDEWSRFMVETDRSGILLKLATEHKLDRREIYYCHLLLADFSIEERMLILQIARATIYRIEQQIFQKIDVPYQAKELSKLLKRMISNVSTDVQDMSHAK